MARKGSPPENQAINKGLNKGMKILGDQGYRRHRNKAIEADRLVKVELNLQAASRKAPMFLDGNNNNKNH